MERNEKIELYNAIYGLIHECEFWISMGTNINRMKLEALRDRGLKLENELFSEE